jgi:hypothetical protein
MLIQCNGLFPSKDKNGAEYIGGVITKGDGKKYFARANVAPGSISLSLSEMLTDNAGFLDAGTVTGVNRGDGSFDFDLFGATLTLVVRRVKKAGTKLEVGTVFLASMVTSKPITQAELGAFIVEAPEFPSEEAPVARKRAAKSKRSHAKA